MVLGVNGMVLEVNGPGVSCPMINDPVGEWSWGN